MSNINLDDYYSKISQIRNRILSQQQLNLPLRSNPPLSKPSEIYQTSDYTIPEAKAQERLPAYLRPQSQPKVPAINPVVIPRPVAVPTVTVSNKASVVEERVDVNARLKELENVNEKIKNMLAGKRSSIVSAAQSKISKKAEEVQAPAPINRWEKQKESTIEGKWERSQVNKRVGGLFTETNKAYEHDAPIIKPISSHYVPPPPASFAPQVHSHLSPLRKQALDQSRRNTSREVERLEKIAESRKRVLKQLEDYRPKSSRKVDNLESSRRSVQKTLQGIRQTPLQTLNPPKQVKPVLETPVNRIDDIVTPTKEERAEKTAAMSGCGPAWMLSNTRRPEVGKLVRALVRQVQLDGELRGLREEFSYWKAQDKWQKLMDALVRTGCMMPEDELHCWMNISKQEHDPFAKVGKSEAVSIAKILAALVEAKRHWDVTVRECVSIETLADEQFGVGELDLSGKGCISTDDLTCFLNMNSAGLELRSRDLAPTMRRFNRMEGVPGLTPQVSYSVFLDYLTK